MRRHAAGAYTNLDACRYHATARDDYFSTRRRFRPDLIGLSSVARSAAAYRRTPLPEESAQDAEQQYRINFLAPVEMIRSLASVRDGREASVVNILDCAIRRTPGRSFSYAISKKMLAEATRAAALQCAPRLRVNAVAPGNLIPPPGSPSRMEKTAARLPLKRTVSLDDFTETVLFLAGNRSLTGCILTVDCGQSLLEAGEEI